MTNGYRKSETEKNRFFIPSVQEAVQANCTESSEASFDSAPSSAFFASKRAAETSHQDTQRPAVSSTAMRCKNATVKRVHVRRAKAEDSVGWAVRRKSSGLEQIQFYDFVASGPLSPQ